MEKEEIKQICTRLVGKKPLKLINKANSLVVQSKPAITLKGSHNHARTYICCVLAIEELQEILDLESPDLSKPPIPKRDFMKLLAEFRYKLIEPEIQSSESEEEPIPTPKRRRRQKISETPTKSSSNSNFTRRFVATGSEPDEIELFVALQTSLELGFQAVETMLTTHKQYVNNVTDRWGLAMAIAFIVVARSSPDKSIGLEEAIVTKAGVKNAQERMDRWMPFAERLLSGQRQLAKISVVLEPVLELRGGPGKWDFKLENEDWWNQEDAMI